MSCKYGVSSTGLIAPIIKEGDDLEIFVCEAVENKIYNIEGGDIIGITESIEERTKGNYITVDEVTVDIKKKLTILMIFWFISQIFLVIDLL